MRDLRHAVYGITIATVAGLILGGVSKPDIREMTDLDGPQLVAGRSGERLGPGVPQAASYGDQVPDDVIGRDWTQPDDPMEMAEAEPEAEPARVTHADPPVRQAPARYEFESSPPPSYPSMGGDILAGLQDAHAPPTLEAAPEEAATPPA